MGVYIIKPDRDVDGYVAWSSVTDGPIAWGDQKFVADYLRRWDGDEAAAPERFERADRTGTSMKDGEDDFSQRGFLVLNGGDSHGWLPRERMWAWLHAGLPDDMLEPLEDDSL